MNSMLQNSSPLPPSPPPSVRGEERGPSGTWGSARKDFEARNLAAKRKRVCWRTNDRLGAGSATKAMLRARWQRWHGEKVPRGVGERVDNWGGGTRLGRVVGAWGRRGELWGGWKRSECNLKGKMKSGFQFDSCDRFSKWRLLVLY